jgi:hypothetical protein
MEFRDQNGKRLDVLNDGVAQLEENRTYKVAVNLSQAAREGWKGWLGQVELSWQAAIPGFEVRTGHWVGSQSLRIVAPSGEQSVVEVDVQPREDKLSGEAWGHLLRDLDRWLPGSSVGQEGGLHGEVGFSGSQAPGVAAVLGNLVPPFLAALEALLRAPRERSVEHWTEAPAHMVRQADRETLRWLVRHPDAHQSLRGGSIERRDGREVLVPRRTWRGDMDHAVNRYVVWLGRQVARVLREVAQRVQTGVKRSKSLDPDLERWCEGRARQLLAGADVLESLLRKPPLGGIDPEPASESALLTLVDDPVYARVHSFGRLFLSPRFQLPPDASLLGAPVRPSYELYELWTFLALRRLFEAQMPGAEWTEDGVKKLQFFDENSHGASYTARWPGRGMLRVYFNLPFPGYLTRDARTGPRWSISKTRRPDLVVMWMPEKGSGRWLCLDAKYRTDAQNVADAFESVHIYHDALRWKDLGDKGRCEGAVLLIPKIAPKVDAWQEKQFRDEHGVGVFCLTPGSPPPDDLTAWLMERLGWTPEEERSPLQ